MNVLKGIAFVLIVEVVFIAFGLAVAWGLQ